MDMPLVSVIVPVFRVENYIKECVDSIINQTYKNLEIILVDDGSPDKSGIICEEYAKFDSRIKVIHKTNGGLSDARNFGLEEVCGKYVLFCDSDDILEHVTVETVVDLAEKYNSDIVGFESVIFSEGKGQLRPIYHNTEEIIHLSSAQLAEKLLYKQIDCSVCNKLFNAEKLVQCRFIKGRYNEDIIFLTQLLGECKNIIMTNYPFYRYRINPESITHTFNLKTLDPLRNINEITEAILDSFPHLSDALFFYTTSAVKTVATSIIRNKARHVSPYKESYEKAKAIIKRNYIKILLSKRFDIRFKFAVTAVIFL